MASYDDDYRDMTIRKREEAREKREAHRAEMAARGYSVRYLRQGPVYLHDKCGVYIGNPDVHDTCCVATSN